MSTHLGVKATQRCLTRCARRQRRRRHRRLFRHWLTETGRMHRRRCGVRVERLRLWRQYQASGRWCHSSCCAAIVGRRRRLQMYGWAVWRQCGNTVHQTQRSGAAQTGRTHVGTFARCDNTLKVIGGRIEDQLQWLRHCGAAELLQGGCGCCCGCILRRQRCGRIRCGRRGR